MIFLRISTGLQELLVEYKLFAMLGTGKHHRDSCFVCDFWSSSESVIILKLLLDAGHWTEDAHQLFLHWDHSEVWGESDWRRPELNDFAGDIRPPRALTLEKITVTATELCFHSLYFLQLVRNFMLSVTRAFCSAAKTRHGQAQKKPCYVSSFTQFIAWRTFLLISTANWL